MTRYDNNQDPRSAVAVTDISPPGRAARLMALSVNHGPVNPPDAFVLVRGNPTAGNEGRARRA